MDNTEYKFLSNYKIFEKNKNKTTFKKQLVIYKQPKYLPDTYGIFQSLIIKKINDFSHFEKNFIQNDYIKAFSTTHKQDSEIIINNRSKTLEELLKKREIFDNNIKKTQIYTKILNI